MQIIRWRDVAGKAAFHAARVIKTAARPLACHGHDFAEIFWIDAGQGTHAINGRKLPLTPGNLIFIRPSDCHGIEANPGEELKLTNIAFPRETLAFLRGRYFEGKKWIFPITPKFPILRQVEPGSLVRLNHWADELSRSPRQRIHLERFLLNLLADLSRQENRGAADKTPDWLARACREIQKPAHFSRGVAEFLRLCNRSREHVARSMRLYLKTTPTHYVNDLRLAYAERQLEMGDQSILEIALDCGMENLSHFYTRFQTRTGTTPRKFRLAHRRPL